MSKTQKKTTKHPGCTPGSKDYSRSLILLHKYGISLNDYKDLLSKQDGLCAICRKPESNRYKMLSVDHDHVTGSVRGLLCQKCNIAIGFLGEDPDTMNRAIDYVNSHSNKNILTFTCLN